MTIDKIDMQKEKFMIYRRNAKKGEATYSPKSHSAPFVSRDCPVTKFRCFYHKKMRKAAKKQAISFWFRKLFISLHRIM